jgi:hypothetical protein
MYYTRSRFTPRRLFCLLCLLCSVHGILFTEAQARIGDGACQVIQRVKRRPVEFNRKMKQGVWILGDQLETRYTVFFNPAEVSIYEEVRPNSGHTISPTVIQQFIKAQQEAVESTDSFKHYFGGEVFDYAGQKMVLEKNMEAYLAPREGILILIQTGEDPYAIAMGREWVQYRQTLKAREQKKQVTRF